MIIHYIRRQIQNAFDHLPFTTILAPLLLCGLAFYSLNLFDGIYQNDVSSSSRQTLAAGTDMTFKKGDHLTATECVSCSVTVQSVGEDGKTMILKNNEEVFEVKRNDTSAEYPWTDQYREELKLERGSEAIIDVAARTVGATFTCTWSATIVVSVVVQSVEGRTLGLQYMDKEFNVTLNHTSAKYPWKDEHGGKFKLAVQ